MASNRWNCQVDVSKLRAIFPLTVPLDFAGHVFNGYITACGRDFGFRIRLPEDNNLKTSDLEGDLHLVKILGCKTGVIRHRLKTSKDLPGLLKELQILLESQLKNEVTACCTKVKPPKYYAALIEGIDALGWERLSYVNSSFSEVHIKFLDPTKREHILKITFQSDYPARSPTIATELPANFDVYWTKAENLCDVCRQFERHLDSLQTFWNVLDEVDRECWVLEPEKPRRSDTCRRIALGKGVSLMFTVDPTYPRRKPSWQLIGGDDVVRPLQDTLDLNLPRWDDKKSVVENWKTTLEIRFPSLDAEKMETFLVECGICYSYKLRNKTPDQICKNQRCNKQFHSECLYEWLRSLQTSRQSFDMVFGECPYCSKAIACKVQL